MDKKEIPLTCGKVAIVDASDYDFLMHWKWTARRNGRNNWYAYRKKRKAEGARSQNIHMHQVILGLGDGVKVDHRDGNGLHNWRSNLRRATQAQNRCNNRLPSNNTSGFKGVTFYKRTGRWMAQISIFNKTTCLGYFGTAIEAARVYDAAAVEHYGEFANLNFPV